MNRAVMRPCFALLHRAAHAVEFVAIRFVNHWFVSDQEAHSLARSRIRAVTVCVASVEVS